MRFSITSIAVLLLAFLTARLHGADDQTTPAALDFIMKTIGGEDIKLDKYRGKVILIVNVASKCGLTPQYEQLQELYERYGSQGLAILAFPCNQFGGQEPGTPEQIRAFCVSNFGVEFDMFGKVEVNGEGACDLYKYLTNLETKPKGAGRVSWNFEKFLLDRKGNVIARFAPGTRPDAREVTELIEAELAKK